VLSPTLTFVGVGTLMGLLPFGLPQFFGHLKVMSAIESCRTAVLAGHVCTRRNRTCGPNGVIEF
jgi:hypothetical protein